MKFNKYSIHIQTNTFSAIATLYNCDNLLGMLKRIIYYLDIRLSDNKLSG